MKNPWICAACKSIVTTRLTPAVVNKSATNLDVIGCLGFAFLSCLAYPKYGMIAVISPADALFKASAKTKISIKFSVTGLDVDWTMKTSFPRTDSSISTKISPSAKW